MGKRRTDTLRSPSEIRQSSQHHYDGYVKKPSKVNPIWMQDNYGIKKETDK